MNQQALPQMPFPREDILDIAPLYRTLLSTAPITPVRTGAGDVAWLVTGYAEAKTLFDDPRLGRSHPEPERAAKISNSVLLGGPMGDASTEADDHTRLRKLFTPAFSARRMRALQKHVANLVDDLLEEFTKRTPPADLHEALSFPLPALVICELLGVPYADREKFRSWSEGMAGLTDREASQAAMRQLFAYMHELVERKRSAPDQDLISDLIAAQPEWGYPDQYISETAALLLFAGHETTVSRIDYGTLLLITHPDQRDALTRDLNLVSRAVEEILRMAAPSSSGLPRYAQADIDIAGVRINMGDAVVLAGSAANRDPAAFPDPDTFDIARETNAHLSFGHGPHYCIGASLARVELREVFTALIQRLPDLRLAVPVEELQVRGDTLTGGLTALPVAW